jgi:glycosyltransferase involved in cell wall biosynthesis
MPRVSIGLPVYNGARFLPRALEALVNQTFTDLEIIICDNASTDATEEICRLFAARDPHVRYLRNATNVGAGKNYNRTFELSSGEYFKWAAHDDVCEPTFVEQCVEALDRMPGVVAAFPRMVDIDEHGTLLGVRNSSHIPRAYRGAAERAYVRFKNLIRTDYTVEEIFGVIRADVLRKTPLILSYTDSDRTLLAELGLHGKLYEVPEVLFLHRLHAGMSTQQYTDWGARSAWFDPAMAGRRVFPHWRQLAEYGKGVLRVPIGAVNRVLCFGLMLQWTVRHRAGLAAEFLQIMPGQRKPRKLGGA